MMSFLLTITLHVFMMRKQAKTNIKVVRIIYNLNFGSLKNINSSGNKFIIYNFLKI